MRAANRLFEDDGSMAYGAARAPLTVDPALLEAELDRMAEAQGASLRADRAVTPSEAFSTEAGTVVAGTGNASPTAPQEVSGDWYANVRLKVSRSKEYHSLRGPACALYNELVCNADTQKSEVVFLNGKRAEEVGFNERSLNRARNALLRAGLIELVEKERPGRAGRYRLTLPHSCRDTSGLLSDAGRCPVG